MSGGLTILRLPKFSLLLHFFRTLAENWPNSVTTRRPINADNGAFSSSSSSSWSGDGLWRVRQAATTRGCGVHPTSPFSVRLEVKREEVVGASVAASRRGEANVVASARRSCCFAPRQSLTISTDVVGIFRVEGHFTTGVPDRLRSDHFR